MAPVKMLNLISDDYSSTSDDEEWNMDSWKLEHGQLNIVHLSSLLAYSNDLKCTTFYHNEYHIIIYTYKYRDATKV